MSLAICVQKGPITRYVYKIRYIYYKVYGIIDYEILDCFIYGLEPIIGQEVLKKSQKILENACVFVEKIPKLSGLVGAGGIHSK